MHSDAPPESGSYFDSRTHRKAMAYLGYGLAQGEGFIVITGDSGTGKTTLVGHLLDTIDRERLNIVRVAPVGGSHILPFVADALDLPDVAAIERALADAAGQGKRTLMIVDDAQNLAVPALEELRALADIRADGEALVQIFLLGDTRFRDMLDTPGLAAFRQQVIASHQLEPLGSDEIGPYLAHRLGPGHAHFTDDAIAALYRDSGGVPGQVNMLAARVLARGVADIDASASAAPAQDVPADIAQRLAIIETRLDDQEAALRRVLTLLIDWVESEEQPRRDSAA